MDYSLDRLIHSNQVLSENHIKYILFQIILGMHYMHSADIIHRDLKPENILINKKCNVKIADLGLSRKYESNKMITESLTFIYSDMLSPEDTEHQKSFSLLQLTPNRSIFGRLDVFLLNF